MRYKSTTTNVCGKYSHAYNVNCTKVGNRNCAAVSFVTVTAPRYHKILPATFGCQLAMPAVQLVQQLSIKLANLHIEHRQFVRNSVSWVANVELRIV